MSGWVLRRGRGEAGFRRREVTYRRGLRLLGVTMLKLAAAADMLLLLPRRREQWDWGCDRFSGGWQMRIALARLLLSPAGQAATTSGSNGGGSGEAGGGLLLLDEPTNHLDAAAVNWLASFLGESCVVFGAFAGCPVKPPQIPT